MNLINSDTYNFYYSLLNEQERKQNPSQLSFKSIKKMPAQLEANAGFNLILIFLLMREVRTQQSYGGFILKSIYFINIIFLVSTNEPARN